MSKSVRLISKSKGFGGDNYSYESIGDEQRSITVSVGWALMSPHLTTVTIDGAVTAEFKNEKYVQPEEALRRLGYSVIG